MNVENLGGSSELASDLLLDWLDEMLVEWAVELLIMEWTQAVASMVWLAAATTR